MTVADALLLALGAIAVGSGALVVTTTHLVRAGLYLVISLGAIAGLYLVLGAELVAWVQVLVYVGAVVVLLLFAVMLTRAPIGPSADLDRPAGPAALIGAGVGFGLTVLLADAFRWSAYDLPPTGTAQRIGEQIFGAWVLPFEVLSILLLAALVGAIVLSRPDIGARPDPDAVAVPPGTPAPDPVAESAAVVARLDRIAARQAAAQARVRQAAAEQRAGSDGEPVEPSPATPARDEDAASRSTARDGVDGAQTSTARDGVDAARRSTARDVVFGAQERRTAIGVEEPAEPSREARGVIDGTATEDTTGADGSGSPRRAVRDRGRPAIGGPSTGQSELDGPADRPALPAGSADERPSGEDDA